MKQEKTSMPYAWYWHGKPLRTGLAQGEKIRPVSTGSHIVETPDHCASDRPCCPPNIQDKPSCPCGHGHGHGNNTETHNWIPESPQQNPNCCYSPGVQQPRHCGPEGQQDQIPRCSAPAFTCQDCPCDTLRPEPCSLDRCCTCTAESTCLPGDPCCRTPQDIPYPASRRKFCPPSFPHCGDSSRTKSHHQATPVKCHQSFTRFESCDRFDCCEDTFVSKCEYSTEESTETGHGHGHGHGHDADFETRSYHRRRPWVNYQLHRKY